MPTKIGQFKSGWSKMRTIFVFLLIVGVALSAPAYRNRLRYHVNAQPRMEKRSETEKESMIHFKETGRIDTESAKRELTSMPQD
ncbi:unnamed protein product, partial [Echinostoma caproni]|uniref:Secreted protein n=1 Tax=Echinostoma caproni TaxID=27848 RepID=A0A183AE85_9TREM